MIVLLLLSFKSWCQNNDNIPLRASNLNDTISKVEVPISIIKKANVKLIERKYLIKLNKEKDSIIQFNNQYILIQKDLINKLNYNLAETQKLNNDIQKDLDKQKRLKNTFIYTTGGACLLIVLVGLLN